MILGDFGFFPSRFGFLEHPKCWKTMYFNLPPAHFYPFPSEITPKYIIFKHSGCSKTRDGGGKNRKSPRITYNYPKVCVIRLCGTGSPLKVAKKKSSFSELVPNVFFSPFFERFLLKISFLPGISRVQALTKN